MISLEEMLRQRQDQLRGRPKNWIDNFGERWRWYDWPLIALITLSLGFAGGVLLALR